MMKYATYDLNLTNPNTAFLSYQDDAIPSMNIQNLVIPRNPQTVTVSNILARVQLCAPPSSVVFSAASARDTTNYLQIPDSYKSRNIKQMTFTWTDENGNLIDFGGMDHSFLLRVFSDGSQQ